MAGRLLLIGRLVRGDLKRRRLQSLMLLVMIATTTTTLALGLALHGVSEGSFARTRAATRGPDATTEYQPNRGSHPNVAKTFAPLLRARGVSAVAGPFPLAFVRLRAPGINIPIQAEGRSAQTSAVDRPLLSAGSWVRPRGVVLEQGLAHSLGLHVGDRVNLGLRRFTIAGIALTTQQAFYPALEPGLVWLTRADATGLAAKGEPLGYVLELRLRDPGAMSAFENTSAANAYFSATANEPSWWSAWKGVRQIDYKVVSVDQRALLIGATLLALLAVAAISVVVGSRLAEQTRRVGLLKAVGTTPRVVAVVLLAENVLLALAAAVVGMLVAQALAPGLTNPGTGLLGHTATPPISMTEVGIVLIVAVAVAAAATLIPALRGARTSTIAALRDPVRAPTRRPVLIALSARLPTPLLLAVRLTARRMKRTVLSATSLAIAVTMVVVALTLEHSVQTHDQLTTVTGLFTSTGVRGQVTHLVFVLSAILVVLAGISATFTTWATVIDAERATALARALGATPREVGAGVALSQLLPALIAACIGIPAGLGLFELAGGHVSNAKPPILWLLAVLPCTLMVVAALAFIPARAGARRSVASVLRFE